MSNAREPHTKKLFDRDNCCNPGGRPKSGVFDHPLPSQSVSSLHRGVGGATHGTLAMALSLDGYAAPTGPGVTADQMHGLMDLLGVGREEEQDERSKPPSLHPAAMAGGKPSQAPPNMKVAVRQPKKKDEKAIWQADEFKAASGVVVKSEGDDRAIPKYEILPRQKLQASDAYLNLQEMDPSSDRCQELLIKVWLPGEQLRDISVDVLEDRLLLQATKHQLNVALPHKAAWQGKQQGSAESGRGDFRAPQKELGSCLLCLGI
ncbi:unnamed protein product [Durusdinium trenchii]|uniref:PIH1D1/2/3 CS-like domain-containing protein n=1 Tax=Durusdinium trenchii TaxID=1381693 RepID=A0ABP0ILP3_9DINO